MICRQPQRRRPRPGQSGTKSVCPTQFGGIACAESLHGGRGLFPMGAVPEVWGWQQLGIQRQELSFREVATEPGSASSADHGGRQRWAAQCRGPVNGELRSPTRRSLNRTNLCKPCGPTWCRMAVTPHTRRSLRSAHVRTDQPLDPATDCGSHKQRIPIPGAHCSSRGARIPRMPRSRRTYFFSSGFCAGGISCALMSYTRRVLSKRATASRSPSGCRAMS